ncbi:MAG TPA: 3-methyl-2-oxobutanoate hydroxymethyltransferase, partial [Alcaligenes faecalis]|nr:3-methyl-2-oxobutanoate hydroxymethyltransferase [Alcaligenes faecalis]
ALISQAAGQYAAEVRDGSFPTLDQCFGVKR